MLQQQLCTFCFPSTTLSTAKKKQKKFHQPHKYSCSAPYGSSAPSLESALQEFHNFFSKITCVSKNSHDTALHMNHVVLVFHQGSFPPVQGCTDIHHAVTSEWDVSDRPFALFQKPSGTPTPLNMLEQITSFFSREICPVYITSTPGY